MRKGQTATEYLIILAVVIVIALIVVGVLGGIPGVGQSGQSKAGTAYWSTIDPLAVKSFSNSASDGLTVILRNNGKNAYTVNNFIVDGTAVNNTDKSIPIGSEATLTSATPACTVNDKYSYEVSINYTDESTDAIYLFTGTQKLEGTCAT